MASGGSSSRTTGKSTSTSGANKQKTGSKVGKIPAAGTMGKKSNRFKVPGQLKRSGGK